MAKHVIIHLPEIGQDYAQWIVADERGVPASEVQSGTLREAADTVQSHRSTLVLPGNDVLLAEAVVPGGNASRALLAVPNVLEDQLADDIDTLHFAMGSKGKDDQYPVAVVGRVSMDLVAEQCKDAGLRPSAIVPETLALPKFDGDGAGEVSWTALIDDTQAVVRLNGYKGFATDSEMASFMLDGAQHDLPEDSTASMVVFQTESGSSLPDVPRVEVETRRCESRLKLYASGLANSPYINLLQGRYGPKTQFTKLWKPWRWTAVLALVLGLVFFAGKWFEYFQLSSKESELDGHITRVFKEALPGKRMVRPEAQMREALKGIGAVVDGSFVTSMHQIAAAISSVPKTEIKSIGYRNGAFTVELTTDALPTLDLLKSAIQKDSKLTMSVKSTTQSGELLRSTIRVE